MRLTDIAMVVGDTSRTRAYLQALVRNELLPNYVLLLDDESGVPLPGQIKNTKASIVEEQVKDNDECWNESHFDSTQPIKVLFDDSDINYEILKTRDINNHVVIRAINKRPESVFIYSGFGGALLRKQILSTGKKFLHVHGGYLPDYKGSTTNYFSLLLEDTVGASSIFLSEELDSGPVLVRRKYPPPENKKAIDHIYDSAARANVLVETLNNYLKLGSWEFELPSNKGGETYYIIHPVLKHIAILS